MRTLFFLLLLKVLWSSAGATLKIQEIRTASNNILVVFLHSNVVKENEVDMESSVWKINGTAPLNMYRYTMESDLCDHYIYMETATLVEGEQYLINTPYGDTTVTFNDHSIFCESIKTNQVAYSALTKTNFANFSIWLGNGGGKQITGALPEYEVFEQYTGKKVMEGVLKEIGENPSSGDFVYKIDLSEVSEGGPYKIAVKGYGCSYPFGVGGLFSKRLAYTMFRSFYYQRCGCPIKAPYGMEIRQNPCHSTVYDVDGPIEEANIEVTGTEPTFKCYGGYHDAGDADRRAYHMSNPIVNLMIYEAFPDLFYDGQFNIPDKFDENYNVIGNKNGIPDIIDEAVWGTLIWEYLQNEDGSIHWGTETQGYPEPFNAPLDKDSKKYGTVKTDNRAAAVGAGLFMHLARIIKPYDTTYSRKLVERAGKSFNYISSKMKNPEKLYYYTQKYLLDGDSAAHQMINTYKSTVDVYKLNLFKANGYSLNDASFDNPAYFLSYLLEPERQTDTSLVNYFKNALRIAADANLAELSKYAYPVGNNPTGTSWGHNVVQPLYSCAPLLYWRLTKEQKYLDGACALMNYLLGLNPLGITYVTGLGFHQVHNPHDRESEYTKGKKWGPKPGITIFGPGVMTQSPPVLFPASSELPVERQFGDDRNSISTAEFTIFETMSHNALFTVLSNGGTWNDSIDPFKTQQVISVEKGYSKKVNLANRQSVKVKLNGNSLKVTVNLKNSGIVRAEIYSMNGSKILKLELGRLGAGTHNINLPLTRIAPGNLSRGLLICKLVVDNHLKACTVVSRI
ncbi:MAG TPA: glycoside hydrolase family 9 protein [Chitinispirillaceae bacterium]|nr:glycoside hydrolase family 9 protein [Chitinispirillaceae bacterium]